MNKHTTISSLGPYLQAIYGQRQYFTLDLEDAILRGEN
jgi:hypothetical protein